MNRIKVAILGATGLIGGELIRLLLAHPRFQISSLIAEDSVGLRIEEALPQLAGFLAQDISRCELPLIEGPSSSYPEAELIFSALPTQVACSLLPSLQDHQRLIDLSGALRFSLAEDFTKNYGLEAPAHNFRAERIYGLPELNREALKTARLVAAPGCFATAAQLALLPLAAAGQLNRSKISLVGVTGSSGSGASPSRSCHHPFRANNLRSYKALEHPHELEMLRGVESAGSMPSRLSFVPISAPLVRGILISATIELEQELSFEALKTLYSDFAAKQPLLTLSDSPEVQRIAGTALVEIGVSTGGKAQSQIVHISCAIDNLLKGGAAQMLQCANIMYGEDECLALPLLSAFP